MKVISIFSLISILLTACSDSKSIDDVYKYIKQPANGLHHEVIGSSYQLHVTYFPSELIAKRSIERKSKALSIDSLLAHYGQFLYIKVHIDKIKYTNLSEAVNIVTSNGQIKPIEIHQSNSINPKGGVDYLVVFDKSKVQTDFTLELHINNELHKFDFLEEDLRGVPALKLK